MAQTGATSTRTPGGGAHHLKPDISTLGGRGHFYIGLTGLEDFYCEFETRIVSLQAT
jgi:hypothetical protein